MDKKNGRRADVMERRRTPKDEASRVSVRISHR